MNKKNKILMILFSIYTGAIIIQNILATKQIDIAIFTVTTGIIVSPLVFIIQDIVAELYGYKDAKKMVLLGFLMNFVGVLLFTLAIYLPSSQFWFNQEAFSTILGTTLRISVASFTAYIIGSLTNSKVMVWLKNKFPKSLFVRAISSTIVGQFLDNMLFATIAFLGILPINAILSMIVGGTIFEVLYEIIFYPITKFSIFKIRKYIEE
jgi:hypothetical protein